MYKRQYEIALSEAERAELLRIVEEKNDTRQKIIRANILLASDLQAEKPMSIAEIARAYNTTITTVKKVRASYVKNGFATTINICLKTEEAKSRIVALSREDPPEGRSKWTYQLLTKEAVKRGCVEAISDKTVAKILRENNISLT